MQADMVGDPLQQRWDVEDALLLLRWMVAAANMSAVRNMVLQPCFAWLAEVLAQAPMAGPNVPPQQPWVNPPVHATLAVWLLAGKQAQCRCTVACAKVLYTQVSASCHSDCLSCTYDIAGMASTLKLP